MSLTQFAMVEELASLVRENIPCKHLILSMEEVLVNFLQDSASLDGVLELEPMNPYYRLLMHRLAEIFGFSHKSIGEGDDRHLILERYPETSIPSILVSDLLWQCGEASSPIILDVLEQNTTPDEHLLGKETRYFTIRERIFSDDGDGLRPVKHRPRSDPVVARRLITRALGQTNKATNQEPSSRSQEYEPIEKDVKFQNVENGAGSGSETVLLSAKHPRSRAFPKVESFSRSELSEPTSKGSQPRNEYVIAKGGFAGERHENNIQETYLQNEQKGAAKRLFANALGIHRK